MITLIHCKLKLEALSIYMEDKGSGALFTDALTQKIPNYRSWEYDFVEDQIKIWVEDGMVIPDLSEFGEVVPNDSIMG